MSVTHAQLVDGGEIARGLRELAGHPLLQVRADELRCLADDLDSGSNLDDWAEVDLLQAFARPESLAPVSVPPARPGMVRRLLALLTGKPWKSWHKVRWSSVRNALRGAGIAKVREETVEAILGVLVFVPLLITWVGLWEAASAYGELSQADPKEATRPFLSLWQSGFGGRLAPIGRFSNVAMMAVLLISALVLVAVWHAGARTRADRERAAQEAARDQVLGRLTSLLTRAQLLLAAHSQGSPKRFTAELSKAASNLSSLTNKAMRGQKTLVQAVQSAEQAANAVESAAQRLVSELPALSAAAGKIEDAVRTGTDALRGAHDASVRSVADNATAVRGVGDRIGQAGTALEAAFKEMAEAQRELLSMSRDVVESTDRASQALVTSAGQTDDAVEGMREAAERWDAAAAHWQDAAARLNASIQQLASATRRQPAPVEVPRPAGSAESRSEGALRSMISWSRRSGRSNRHSSGSKTAPMLQDAAGGDPDAHGPVSAVANDPAHGAGK